MTPTDTDPTSAKARQIVVVTWWTPDGIQQSRTVASVDYANDLVLDLRARGLQAGWDVIDPFSGDGFNSSGAGS